MEASLLSIGLSNLVVMVALKYHLNERYDLHRDKLPSFFPETFCLMCFSFWVSVLISAPITLLLEQPLQYYLISIVLTPALSVIVHK